MELPSSAIAEYSIVSFEDAAHCLSKLLSITDQLIYFVVTKKLGRFVVPLVHNHRCVEHIYVYQDSQDEQSCEWMKDYSKTLLVQSSIESLVYKMKEDIRSIMQLPTRWSRSRVLLTELCSQTCHPEPISGLCEEDLSICSIALLYYDGRRLFDFSHPKLRVVRYYTVEECIKSIKYDSSTSVFLIISMHRPADLCPILDLEAVHAAYVVTDVDYIPQMQSIQMHSKLCGIFVPNEDLLDQLTSDICFYRQMRVHVPNISIFQVKSKLLDKLDKEQVDFLRFQLFSAILSQMPSPTIEDHAQCHDQLLARLSKANMNLNQLFKQFNNSIPEASVVELKRINQHIVSLSDHIESSAITVYRAQLISQKDLKLIKDNPNALFAIQAFILASRSLNSIVKICRQAMDNQLTVVLLELNLTEQASVMYISNSDLVVFQLGTLFRVVSIESAPDNVLHIQLGYVNNIMQYIENELQNKIGYRLTWLTFGSYLAALEQSSAAETYYKYLVTILPDHLNIAAIRNDDDRISPTETIFSHEIPQLSSNNAPIVQSLPTDDGTEKIRVLRRMADISYRRQDYATALVFYRQALEIDNDPRWKEFYQCKIDTLSYFHRP